MARLTQTTKGKNHTTTHEGGKAIIHNPEKQLERAVLACMLWEDTFYESGQDIAERIADLTQQVSVQTAVDIATRARRDMYIRHAPLWVMNHLLPRAEEARKQGISLSDTLASLMTRPDDLPEMLALYWKNGKKPLSAQLKKAFAKAFPKFDEYQLAKYNRQQDITLRDIMFLAHPKPTSKAQEDLFKRLVNNELQTPDTWEVNISAAKGDNNKAREAWERLLMENRLGAVAFLRNLANMQKVGVNPQLIRAYMRHRKAWPMVSPFQFVNAYRVAPDYMDELEAAMLSSIKDQPRLSGRTLLCVDTSGSMDASLSPRSIVTRIDTAAGLAMVLREVCETVQVVMYGNSNLKVPAYHGFAMRDFIVDYPNRAAAGFGTETGKVLRMHNSSSYDRVIVVTDEQTSDVLPPAMKNSYIINVGTFAPSIAYGKWTSLTGWSDRLVQYIARIEEL